MQPAVDSARADLSRIGVPHGAVVFAPLQVAPGAMALLHRVGGPAQQDLLHLRPVAEPPHAPAPDTTGDGRRQPVHHLAQHRGQLIGIQVSHEQAHAARDVEPDTARRDHTAVRNIGRRDPTDREPVPPVHIRHRIRRLHDAGQLRDIDHLLQRSVRGQVREQRPGREHHTGHPHPPMPRDDEPVRRLLDDLHHRYPSRQLPAGQLAAMARARGPGALAQWMTWPMGW